MKIPLARSISNTGSPSDGRFYGCLESLQSLGSQALRRPYQQPEEVVVNIGTARDDPRERRIGWLELGYATACFAHEHRAGHPIPGFLNRFEVPVVASRRYIRKIERGRAEAPHVAHLTDHVRDDPALDHTLRRNVTEPRGDERAREVLFLANAKPLGA